MRINIINICLISAYNVWHQLTQGHNMTLWDLTQGTSATVSAFAASIEAGYRTRLSELGFYPGESIACVMAPSLGAPKLYRVNNTVYSLDDSTASMIEID